MSQSMVLDVMQDAFMTVISVSGPVLITALVVGLLISILQATTQIQEQTMTFVPKIVAVVIVLMVTGGFMLNTLVSFTNRIFALIAKII